MVGRRVSNAIRTAGGYSGGGIPLTILLPEEIALTTAFVAIGNIDAISILVVVTVPDMHDIRTRPRHINLPDVVGAARIGVVIDLHRNLSSCWADS